MAAHDICAYRGGARLDVASICRGVGQLRGLRQATFRWDPNVQYHLDLSFEEIRGGSNFLNLIVDSTLTAPALSGTQSAAGAWSMELKVQPFQTEKLYRALGGSDSVQVSVTFDRDASLGPKGLALETFALSTQDKGECNPPP